MTHISAVLMVFIGFLFNIHAYMRTGVLYASRTLFVFLKRNGLRSLQEFAPGYTLQAFTESLNLPPKAMSSISNDIVILLYLSNKMLTAFIS